MEKTENPYERKKRIDEEIEKLIIKLCHHIDSEIDNMNDLISGEVAEMTKALAMLVSVSKIMTLQLIVLTCLNRIYEA